MNKIYNNPLEISSTINTKCFWMKLFSHEEVDQIVEYCKKTDTFQGGLQNGTDFNYRKSGISMHNKNDENRWIFEKINHAIESANRDFFQYNLIGYEFFQYGTYGVDDFYHYHADAFFDNTVFDKNTFLCRKLSLSILLSGADEFEGGDFEICLGNPDYPNRYHLEKGDVIFFPSYVLHRVTPVTKGIRQSLVVWVLGPKWV
jgi:PKHD-type hydroxylase